MKASFIVLTMTGMVLAAPASEALVKRQPQNYCGDSLFIDRTNGGSPSISDCEGIINNISNGYGVWADYLPNTDEDPVRALRYGGCVFGLRKSYAGPQSQYTLVGAQDAIDLIRDSISKFGRDGRVGAEGAMECNVFAAGTGTWWGIFAV